MITTIFGIGAIVIALFALALQRLYNAVPAREIKRLAARNDQLARQLYRVVAYDASLRILLWTLTLAGLPVGVWLLAQQVALPVVAAVLAAVLAIAFVWLPSLRLTVHTARLAAACTPALDKILQYTHGPLDALAHFIGNHRALAAHTGLFEKEDITMLLEQQREQPDNRISGHQLELIQRALHFEDKKAADILVPCAKTRMLEANETLGPILLDELHKSGQPSFLVYEGSPDTVIGTLSMKVAASAKHGGKVAQLMRADLCFVHEDFTLLQVAEALTQTKLQVAVVVNAFAEAAGIITLEQLLREAFGVMPAEDIAYDDRKAVAEYHPKPEQPDQDKQPEEIEPVADQADTTTADAEQSDKPVVEPQAEQVNKPMSSPEAPEVVE